MSLKMDQSDRETALLTNTIDKALNSCAAQYFYVVVMVSVMFEEGKYFLFVLLTDSAVISVQSFTMVSKVENST